MLNLCSNTLRKQIKTWKKKKKNVKQNTHKYCTIYARKSSESENNATKQNQNSTDVLSESTLECMRQQVIRQRIKVEAER